MGDLAGDVGCEQLDREDLLFACGGEAEDLLVHRRGGVAVFGFDLQLVDAGVRNGHRECTGFVGGSEPAFSGDHAEAHRLIHVGVAAEGDHEGVHVGSAAGR